ENLRQACVVGCQRFEEQRCQDESCRLGVNKEVVPRDGGAYQGAGEDATLLSARSSVVGGRGHGFSRMPVRWTAYRAMLSSAVFNQGAGQLLEYDTERSVWDDIVAYCERNHKSSEGVAQAFLFDSPLLSANLRHSSQ